MFGCEGSTTFMFIFILVPDADIVAHFAMLKFSQQRYERGARMPRSLKKAKPGISFHACPFRSVF
jgi:hypothetical protein